MKKSTMLTLALGGLIVLLGFSPQGTIDGALQQLQTEVAQLGLRVAKLEHAAGAAPVAAAPTSSSGAAPQQASPARTMTIVSISQSNHGSDNAAEIARLHRKSDSMMSTVDQYAVKAADDAGQDLYAGRSSEGERGWGQASGSTIASTNVGAAGRQVMGDEMLKNRYSTEAYIAREKAKKLQAAADKPKQVIHGHDGDTIFTLETTRDLTDALDQISIGDTVTWRGTRQDASDTSESWTITSIQKVN